MAERVLEKAKANFCDFFETTTTPCSNDGKSAEDALRHAAEELFKF
jgi:hypothetical protein